jgi:hypothetical protein
LLFLVFFFDRFVECDEDDGDFLLGSVLPSVGLALPESITSSIMSLQMAFKISLSISSSSNISFSSLSKIEQTKSELSCLLYLSTSKFLSSATDAFIDSLS